ncbi:hypothetical protein KSS87_009587 [Heliosperma pusillum]|nr:hypothetical protein KSS87_009587 [Heliosperma pusillum]
MEKQEEDSHTKAAVIPHHRKSFKDLCGILQPASLLTYLPPMASSLCLLPFFLFSLSFLASSTTSTTPANDALYGNEESESVGHELYKEYLRDEAVSRLNELGKVSDVDGYLERTFMSPASIKAASVIRLWMEDAGLTTWVDFMGNVHGRVDGMNASAPALLIGSHMDTVVDAGKFDGALGIISAISALKVLKVIDKLESLKRPIEVSISLPYTPSILIGCNSCKLLKMIK